MPIVIYYVFFYGQASLREAAAYFGYQPNYFSRLCRKLFGHDFVHLRIRIRMNIAENELRLTNKRLEEISSELGYQDVANFSKTFSQLKGITPGAFRKKYGIKKAR
ncbi:helix-turn-helix transcriptional regulator [uncultured Lactobacillus sp.]|uniref:helix-turn-helix domain-containing protein n=1 Tax=uncultured Lactobacillus sp. TaxID=153152 RepID=UPI00266531EE|nr:helix-turn-helix transcriptional regulator [uncultured Lactobacillus sp.]